MVPKKVVERMNLLTRQKQDRFTLVRLCLVSHHFVLDSNYSLKGRGVYLPLDKESIQKIFRKGILKKYSQESDYEALLKEVLAYVDRRTNS